MVLEPVGGDAWLERPGARRVVQLKTLGNGTWALLICENRRGPLLKTEPVHDLAFLTASLNDNGESWRACKAMFGR